MNTRKHARAHTQDSGKSPECIPHGPVQAMNGGVGINATLHTWKWSVCCFHAAYFHAIIPNILASLCTIVFGEHREMADNFPYLVKPTGKQCGHLTTQCTYMVIANCI